MRTLGKIGAAAKEAVPALIAAMMRADLAQKHCYYLVALNPEHPDAPLVGYAGLLSPLRASDADIQTIAVAPDARGHGLGRTLMLALITEAVRRDARRVFLEVRADNPGAQHLYETLGFASIGIRRGYYQPDNVDAVVMRLELDALVTVETPKGMS